MAKRQGVRREEGPERHRRGHHQYCGTATDNTSVRKQIEFRDRLRRPNVGKILRRECAMKRSRGRPEGRQETIGA